MEEEDEIQAQAIKFPRFGSGGRNDHHDNNKIAPRDHILNNEDVENIGGGGGELRTRRGGGGISGGGTPTPTNNNRLHSWHSSRIIRVSRASGGKDRHSKVMTSKGLRDRRVRLSVTTAIQFYDLQDRLGYDQPSKAVEWLIKSASDAISELPSLKNTFFDIPKQLSDEKKGNLGLTEQGFADDSADAELDHGDEGNYNNNHHQQNQSQNLSLSKSACSSTSETSKGSGLSLSRSDIRVKARERARERAAKEKKDNNNNNNESLHLINAHRQHHQNVNPVSQTASFTELLTGGINNAVPTTNSPTGSVHQNHGSDEPNNLFGKAARQQQQQQQQWGSAPMAMDYFSPVFMGPSSSSRTQQQQHQSSSEYSASQIQLGHSLAEAMSFNVVCGGDNQNQNHHHSSTDQLQQHFSLIHDQLMPAVVTSSQQQPSGNNNNDYNLNFTMLSSSSSTGLAGYNNNRGTLQSNSSHPSSNNNNNNHLLPHHHHHLQRFSVPTMDGSTVPFFFGAAAAPVASAAAAMENHHQLQMFSPAFDGRLQLCYGGDGSRHSDQKGKAKN